MSSSQLSSISRKKIGHSRRWFLGGAMASVAAGSLLETAAAFGAENPTTKAELWIGAATADITPKPPVALTGFQSVRITRTIQSPLTANVLALESRQGDRVVDQAILVSCDLCVIRPGIQEGFRKHVAARLPGFDINKLFLAATHTHSAPVMVQDQYDEKDYGDAMQPKDYVPFLYERMADAVVKAWESRAAGAVAWGLGHAVVGHNRRVVYADGHAQMLGNTNDPSSATSRATRTTPSTSSASTTTGSGSRRRPSRWPARRRCPKARPSSAPISGTTRRELLRQRYGKELCVLGFCAPAGDQCPHLSLSQEERSPHGSASRPDADPGVGPPHRRRVLRRRRRDRQGHPRRRAAGPPGPAGRSADADRHRRRIRHRQEGLRRHRCQEGARQAGCVGPATVRGHLPALRGPAEGPKPVYPMELHVLRLGDVAIATNPFELYVDYGVQIEARSAAEQTILIQLAATGQEDAYYVPTPRAVEAGELTASPMNNYSATPGQHRRPRRRPSAGRPHGRGDRRALEGAGEVGTFRRVARGSSARRECGD